MTSTDQLAGAPHGQDGEPSTDHKADAEPKPRALVPSRDQLISSFQKSAVRGEREGELLMRHLNGAFEQLHLLFPEANSLAKRDHFILLLEQDPTDADKVIFVAQVCRCGDRLSCCYNIRA